MLHLAVETYLKKGLTGEVPKDIISPSLDRDQLNAVQDCIDYLDNIMRSIMGDYDIFIEKRVYLHSLSQWLYECDGTCDIIITTKDSIIVIDWKFGQGIPVYADRNDQLYAYAAGAWAEYAPDNLEVQIEVHVVQPRLDNFDSASITSADLHNWITSRVEPSLARAYSKNPPFNPGVNQCRWCPAKSTCRARFNTANQTAADVFGAHAKLPNEIGLEDIGALLDKAPQLEDYIKDLRVFVQRKLEQGIEVPGWKIVLGRSNRAWVDYSEAEEWLLENFDYEDIYTTKLVSPAQAEKLERTLKKDESFQSLIHKPEGKTTMVREDDKRPAVDFKSASEKFKEALNEQ
jgi:hypothetical protein